MHYMALPAFADTAYGAIWRPFGQSSKQAAIPKTMPPAVVKNGRFPPVFCSISAYRNHMIVVYTVEVLYNNGVMSKERIWQSESRFMSAFQPMVRL